MKKTLLNLTCLLGITAGLQAGVTFVANDLATDARWRSSDVQKLDDLDGDNIYGTAGYYLASGLFSGYKAPFLTDNIITGASNPNDINTLPSWILSLEFTNPAERGRSWGGDGGNFGTLDNVGGGHTGMTGAPILLADGSSSPMSLTLKRSDSPAFRLALILGNNPGEGGFNDPQGQQITVDDGAEPVTQISGDTQFYSRTTYQLWDIPAGSSDITIVFQGIPLGASMARLSGIAIDALDIPPVILKQPVGGTFLADIPFNLSVTAAGPPPLWYQWYKNDAEAPDGTEATLAFANLAVADAATYYVVVSNSGGSVTSNPVAINVVAELPAKTVNYENAVQSELSVFAYYTFNAVTADDLTTTHNGTLGGATVFGPGLGGEPDKALILNGQGHVNLGVSEDFDFGDTTGTIEAWLRADWTTAAAAPCIFANRSSAGTRWSIHLTPDKSQVAFWNGSQALYIALPANAGTAWHHFVCVFDNGSWLVYWDGQLAGSATIGFVGSTGLPTQLGSSTEASTTEGWIGAIDEVAFYSDALGAEAASAHFSAFRAGEPPVIANIQPQSGEYLAGISATLKVFATGPAPFTYKWYKNDTLIPDAGESSFTIASLGAADAASYYAVVSNEGGSVTSSPVAITVAAELPAKTLAYQDALAGELSLFAYYPFNALTADDLSTAHNGTLFGQAGFGTGPAGGADKALFLNGPGHVKLGVSPDFEFSDTTGTVEAWLRADWTTVTFNPSIFANRNGGGTRWSIHMAADKSQLAFWNGAQVLWLALPANAGTDWHHFATVFDNGTWLIYWDGQLAGSGSIALGNGSGLPTQIGSATDESSAEGWVGAIDEVAFYSDALSLEAVKAHFDTFHTGEPPVIVSQPQGGTYLIGSDVNLSVSATGPELSYQWYWNGEPVLDATGPSLAFASATPEISGKYSVTVENPTATVTSLVAVVRVVVPDVNAFRASMQAQPGLISLYPFDDSTADDAVAENNGTVVGTTTFEAGMGGDPNLALTLAGGSVTLGQVEALDFASKSGTVELLLRADWTASPGYNPTIIADREGGPVNYSIHLMVPKNQIAFWNGTAVSFINIPEAGLTWHHFAVVFDAGNWSIYWDGKLQGTQPLAMGTHPEAPCNLGSASSTGSEQWLGALDEVAFFSTALSAEAIQEHYGALVSAAPKLRYEQAGKQLTFSWIGTSFKLQSNSELANSAGWQDVAGGDVSPVSTAMSASGKLFFRLVEK